jgi:hypothetical protein
MKPEVLLELLESAAEQLKIRVSYEPLQSSVVPGGLCKVKGEYRVIVDKRASAEERVATLAGAIARMVERTQADTTALDLSPKVQEVLRLYSAPRAPGALAMPGRGGRAA